MCDVCCEKFNLSTRKQVTCPYCPFNFCRECCSQFVLDVSDEPACMNCKRPWSRDFMTSAFTQIWMNTSYRTKRENLLFDRERSLMPATQHLVEKEIKIRHFTTENELIIDEMLKNQSEIVKIQRRPNSDHEDTMNSYTVMQEYAEKNAVFQVCINYNTIRINYIRTNGTHMHKNERRTFVRACPASECRGFLSSAWKCGLCEVWVCPDCHEIKGNERDSEHTCDPGNLETARLLEKDSKPCPKCASMIFKQHGCDQMFCTQCNTAFSWNTGRIETNRIHNPHYFDYLRQRAGDDGEIRREIGDIPCGGMPHTNNIMNRLKAAGGIPDSTHVNLERAARGAHHIEAVTLARYRVNILNDNQDMRIKYMINDFDEDEFKRQLQLREHQTERKNAIAAVLNTYIILVSEVFRKLISVNDYSIFFKEYLDEIEQIRTFTNEAMNRTSKMYKRCLVPFVNTGYSCDW